MISNNEVGVRIDHGSSFEPVGSKQQATIHGNDLENDYTGTGKLNLVTHDRRNDAAAAIYGRWGATTLTEAIAP